MTERGSTATLHPIHGTRRTRPWIHCGTGVCKARFQGAASPCSRWPIASFTLSGFTNPVRLHPVYPCILGLRDGPAQHDITGEMVSPLDLYLRDGPVQNDIPGEMVRPLDLYIRDGPAQNDIPGEVMRSLDLYIRDGPAPNDIAGEMVRPLDLYIRDGPAQNDSPGEKTYGP